MGLFQGWWDSNEFSSKLLLVILLNSWRETKIKTNEKRSLILVGNHSTLSPTHSGGCTWNPGKTGRSWLRVRILTRIRSPRCLSIVPSQEEGRISHYSFLFKAKPIGYLSSLSNGQVLPAFPCLSCFVSWELRNHRSEAPITQPDRNVGCTLLSASVFPTGNFFFLWALFESGSQA